MVLIFWFRFVIEGCLCLTETTRALSHLLLGDVDNVDLEGVELEDAIVSYYLNKE